MKLVGMVLVFTSALGSAALGVTIYTQPWDAGTGGTASQNVSSGNLFTAYDNFTLAANASIDSLSWTGAWDNPSTQGTATGFTISFWTDNAGLPGPLLQSFSISGNASETTTGVGQVYSYSANLSSAFNALAATQYWLSIVAETNSVQPQWFWSRSLVGDNKHAQSVGNNPPQQIQGDLAFTLNGTITGGDDNRVPDSGATVLLLAGSLVALGLLRAKVSIALR
jgi:hypothetical protein